jgi:hypothetical protein
VDEAESRAIMQMAGTRFPSGSMTKGDLLETAAAARVPASVVEVLLRLPDRRYNDLYDLRAQLAVVERSVPRRASPRR